MSAAFQFLDALFGELPHGHHINIWVKGPDGGRSYWPSSPEDAAALLDSLSREEVYVCVSSAAADYGPNYRLKADPASLRPPAAIFGLWVDIDCRTEYRNKAMLPATLDDAKRIIPEDLPPTLIVASGGGMHAWWLFDEPVVFGDDAARKAAADVSFRWQELLRRRAAQNGWLLDHTHDLTRVLRVPGARNAKADFTVRLLSADGPRYSLRDLAEAIEESETVDKALGVKVASPKAGKSGGDGWREVPIAVHPGMAAPADLIDQLCQIDARFRATWLKDRPDIQGQKDQFSEYEMAIANFGVAADLSPQRVAELIVEFRRKHGGDMKKVTRLDYLQRTVYEAILSFQAREQKSKARPTFESDEASPAAEPRNEALPAVAEEPSTDTPKDPMEPVSVWFGFRVIQLIKITGKQPSYLLETEHGKVEIESASRLLAQETMRALIAAATNRLIPRFKAVEWDHVVKILLAHVTERDGGMELAIETEMLGFLQEYLSTVAVLTTFQGVPASQLRRPVTVDNAIAINLTDFAGFLVRNHSYRVTLPKLAAMVAALGAEGLRFRANKLDQSRWKLPTERFKAADYVGGFEKSA